MESVGNLSCKIKPSVLETPTHRMEQTPRRLSPPPLEPARAPRYAYPQNAATPRFTSIAFFLEHDNNDRGDASENRGPQDQAPSSRNEESSDEFDEADQEVASFNRIMLERIERRQPSFDSDEPSTSRHRNTRTSPPNPSVLPLIPTHFSAPSRPFRLAPKIRRFEENNSPQVREILS